MGDQHRTARQRTLVPQWLARNRAEEAPPPAPVHRDDLLRYRTVDLELEAQYRDVRRQLDDYEHSRDPEPHGKWNRVCGECGYINHERFRSCESCGSPMVHESAPECRCPQCSAPVEMSARECARCGSRFWSPIIVHAQEDREGAPAAGGEGGGGQP